MTVAVCDPMFARLDCDEWERTIGDAFAMHRKRGGGSGIKGVFGGLTQSCLCRALVLLSSHCGSLDRNSVFFDCGYADGLCAPSQPCSQPSVAAPAQLWCPGTRMSLPAAGAHLQGLHCVRHCVRRSLAAHSCAPAGACA